jgi:hypothetical protein
VRRLELSGIITVINRKYGLPCQYVSFSERVPRESEHVTYQFLCQPDHPDADISMRLLNIYLSEFIQKKIMAHEKAPQLWAMSQNVAGQLS